MIYKYLTKHADYNSYAHSGYSNPYVHARAIRMPNLVRPTPPPPPEKANVAPALIGGGFGVGATIGAVKGRKAGRVDELSRIKAEHRTLTSQARQTRTKPVRAIQSAREATEVRKGLKPLVNAAGRSQALRTGGRYGAIGLGIGAAGYGAYRALGGGK